MRRSSPSRAHRFWRRPTATPTISRRWARRWRSSRTCAAIGAADSSSRSSGGGRPKADLHWRGCSTFTIASGSTTFTATRSRPTSRNTRGRLVALAEEAEAVRAQAFAWCLLGESLLLHSPHWDEAAACLEAKLRTALLARKHALRRASVAAPRRADGEPRRIGRGRRPATARVGDRDRVADGDGTRGAGSTLRPPSLTWSRATRSRLPVPSAPPPPPPSGTETARPAALSSTQSRRRRSARSAISTRRERMPRRRRVLPGCSTARPGARWRRRRPQVWPRPRARRPRRANTSGRPPRCTSASATPTGPPGRWGQAAALV